ncbi:hydroxymethylglutaryl-CoA synthase [Hibiscus syriacus]|uniref:Hydroxymethylglutaryl-CoA synthase n=1 Tax=Hibiscus syriacus TaxID=106335 RepID=A0A6A2ZTT7_HIBSY|nr:molybdenum cofactor sulfurase-like [Hibiscus syriacus]KAE8694612.1 hydroxymethylglutaryl-CoA synthase [Hibiscus syriacus]
MQSHWLRDVSKACSSGCCPNAFVGFPESNAQIPGSAAASRHEFEVCTANSLYPNSHFTNHESLPPFEESFACFNKVYPQYSQTKQADHIRAKEYCHLSHSKHVCLDYVGHGLFSYSQLQTQFPGSTLFPSSSLSLEPAIFDISYKSINLNSQVLYGTREESQFESDIRKRIMAFMNISEADYSMVLTATQSSAFKLLSECYPFQSSKNLLTVYDYQSEAVQVMIESSKKRGANVMSADFSWPNLEIQSEKLRGKIVSRSKYKRRGLFVFPLQSWVTGSRYSCLWMSMARENGWHVLLDASALGAKDMETLGLSLFNPDFLICSFFKVFGVNPSGFCCLFIKKSNASILNDSVTATMVGVLHLVPSSGPAQIPEKSAKVDEVMDTSFESGNSEISNTPRIECRSLDHADSLGLILISSRTRGLINWLVNALMSLRHPNSENGIPAVKIYGPKIMFDRGPAVAFNVFDWKGERIGPALIQKLADRNNISLSLGFLQHIWFSDKHEEKVLETRTSEAEGTTLSKKSHKFPAGISVVTAALSFITNFEDIYRLWAFISRFLDADFLEKEKWRYKALNQKTIEV